MPVHLSTQANTLNAEACGFWQDLGVERVILAREVPLREIAEIHEQLPGLQLECFVHGSLCVAYSGRCVISDYLTDNTKNSNKGMCGNSCRWEFEPAGKSEEENKKDDALPSLKTRPDTHYTFEEDQHGTYMLNSKDLCLVQHLNKLQNAGVVSFKVEGRTKSVFYVATAGRVYKEAIDYFQTHDTAPEEMLAQWAKDLAQAGNRGFTEGFLNGRPNETAYNYQSAQTQQEAMFIASVSGTPHIEYGVPFVSKNPVSVGETLTWMTPTQTVSFEVDALLDKNGLPMTTAHTNQIFYLLPPAELNTSTGDVAWSLLSRREAAQASSVASTTGKDSSTCAV